MRINKSLTSLVIALPFNGYEERQNQHPTLSNSEALRTIMKPQ